MDLLTTDLLTTDLLTMDLLTRSLLEYRGSFNRFDLRVSKAQAESLAQLFFRMGTPRATMWKTRPYGRPAPSKRLFGWPMLAEAWGSLRHDLALAEASGEPAGRGMSHGVSDPRC